MCSEYDPINHLIISISRLNYSKSVASISPRNTYFSFLPKKHCTSAQVLAFLNLLTETQTTSTQVCGPLPPPSFLSWHSLPICTPSPSRTASLIDFWLLLHMATSLLLLIFLNMPLTTEHFLTNTFKIQVNF
jgi:hypothetical protein